MDWYLAVLKKYAVFDGRARRKEYWMFILINAIIGWILNYIDGSLGWRNATGYGMISGLYALGVLLPGLGVMIRRLHDVGRSGWFFWINLIPILGWIWFFIVLITDSNPGNNQYGPNPKGVDYSAAAYKPAAESIAQPAEIKGSGADPTDQIKKLAELKEAGLISEEEFKTKKQELLDRM
jgi:uncharacterized membrane protein YhaH (DUF805 family)